MNNVNENKECNVKLIKHFIKDLSFENPQNINQLNADFNNNNKINTNMDVIFEAYKKDHFTLILKYMLDCSSKNNNEKLFHLELEYFGFFKCLALNDLDQKSLTQNSLKLIFPYAKEVIEEVTLKGGSIAITVNNIDFNLLKN